MGQYEDLITRVYDKLDKKGNYSPKEKYHDFFINNADFRLEEHNLWTYWQGRGVRNPKIMIIGQDWGSIEQSRKYYEYIKNNPDERVVCFEQLRKVGGYEDADFKTDEELVKLVSILGEYPLVCEKQYPDLYFTNLIPGYRNCTSSTGKGSEAKKGVTNGVMKDFRKLLEILQPKIIICLGRLVSESILNEYNHKGIIKEAGSYNKFLDGILNKDKPQPIKLKLDNGKYVTMFAIAHLGNFGKNNRRSNFKDENIKNDYPEADWRVIGDYIKEHRI